MGIFTARQLKAIRWYLGENPKLRLQLSSPPRVYFRNSRNKVVSVHINDITSLFNTANEEDKRERARERKQNKV